MIPLRLKKNGWFSYGLEIKGKLYEYLGVLHIQATSTRMYWETDDDKKQPDKDVQ